VALPDAPMTVIDDSVSWAQWPGRWGASPGGQELFDQASPIGPLQHNVSSDPKGFYDGGESCDI